MGRRGGGFVFVDGDAVRHAREGARLTQGEVGRKLGVHGSSVCAMETVPSRAFRQDLVARLADLLSTPIDQLLRKVFVDPARLMSARRNVGYTRRVLAVEAGISSVDIGKLERGTAAYRGGGVPLGISPQKAQDLARALEVPLEYIQGDAPDVPPRRGWRTGSGAYRT